MRPNRFACEKKKMGDKMGDKMGENDLEEKRYESAVQRRRINGGKSVKNGRWNRPNRNVRAGKSEAARRHNNKYDTGKVAWC